MACSKYPTIDWTSNEYHKLREAVDLLKAVLEREAKRSCTRQHLVPGDEEVVEEVIAMLEERIDYDPTPNEPGEPPMTMDEMHSAAWKEHQEMHR
jgi:hypothetical protein